MDMCDNMHTPMTVEERLGRIDEKMETITKSLPLIIDDVESLKEFKWKIIGAGGVTIGIIVPAYTVLITIVMNGLI